MTYIMIFVAKTLEVSVATLRAVLVNKGMRKIAVVLSAIEITLWLAVASKVLIGLQEDVWKGVAYGLAYMVGIYLGMCLEDRMALGYSRIEIMSEKEQAKEITKALRSKGYTVTSLDSKGLHGDKLVLVVDIPRKTVEATTSFIRQYSGIYVTVCDIRSIKIGQVGTRPLK